MTKRYDFDVLVVGLGPAGSRAAWAAASAGHSVLAVDRRRRPGFPVQCAEFVPAMLDQEIEGLDAVTRQRIVSMRTLVEDEPPDITKDFRGRMLDRGAFDRMLVAAAAEAGATCRFAGHVDAIAADGTVSLVDGTQVRPRVLIGADGPRSTVGHAIGRVNREIVETRQISVPLLRPYDATDIFLSAEIAGGYAWLFPRGDIANVGLGVAREVRHRLKPLLDSLHCRLVADGSVGQGILALTGGAIPVGGLLDSAGWLGKTAVLLAGDAAGLSNPVTGAGINAAILSGTLAGEAATAILAGDDEAPDDYRDELEALFSQSLARALLRRRKLMDSINGGSAPSPAALRAGWIAYPEYWADRGPTTTTERECLV